MLVTMTHEDRPGVELEVEQVQYRYAYYPVGWRSADDPDWVGAGFTPPIPHASDASLHGGGQELDFAELSSNLNGLTANPFNLTAVPGLVVDVPDIDRPVWLIAQLWMEHSVANSVLVAAIAPVGTTTIGNQIAAGLGFVGAIGKECSPHAWGRLAPSSPGSYQAFVNSDTAGTINLIANATSRNRIAALAV